MVMRLYKLYVSHIIYRESFWKIFVFNKNNCDIASRDVLSIVGYTCKNPIRRAL